ncbi:hypothetical protein [Phaeobacter inhibens]|uniref:hypothetical protein n=1 Tax=Phaeobacter inhibens TaxID=221822 RepID=UPI0021A79AA7|nr:hypothetical protein [Phaeobacter inhibens]
MMIAPILKNDLYTILRDNVGMSANLLEQYTYPDVEHDRLAAFIAELRDLLEIQRQLLPPFNFQMLKGLLQIAAELDALPYLEDEPQRSYRRIWRLLPPTHRSIQKFHAHPGH